DFVDCRKMRVVGIELCAQLRERIEWQTLAEDIGKRAKNRPVFLCLARCKACTVRQLNAALGVHVCNRLLGIRRAWQNNVGAVRTGITMAANVDREGRADLLHVELVSAEQEQN